MTDTPQNPAEPAPRADHATRFSTERQPDQRRQDVGGNAPWSIRKSVKHLARQPVVEKDGKLSIALPVGATAAQRIASVTLLKALDPESRDHMRAVEWATDNIDGKLAQVNLNEDLGKFDGMSDEELHEYNRKLDQRIAAASAAVNGPQQSAGNDNAGDAQREGADRGEPGAPGGKDEGAAAPVGDAPIA